MLSQVGNALTAYAHYIASKEGATGLIVTVIVRDESNAKIINGVYATEVGEGWYEYTLSAGNVDAAGDYKFTFHTESDTVDQKDIPALYIVREWKDGGGANLVTISVDDGADAISDVRVEIRDSGGNYITHAMTDGDGDVTFNLDDGTYSVYCRKTGYTFTQPETVTVDEDPEAATISGTAISIPTPASADECYVYDDVGVPSNVDYPNTITATARIVGLPLDYAGRLWSGQKYTATYNSTTGRFFWYLPRNATVYFDVEIGNTETQARYLKKIDGAASARMSDLEAA